MEGATMDVDDEDADDLQKLQELIRKQSEVNTKSLQQELNTLQQQIKGLKSSSTKTAREAHPAHHNKNKKVEKATQKPSPIESKSPRPHRNGNQ
jgi:archaellum component FlaC